MAKLIKTIKVGDENLQIDYTALANTPDFANITQALSDLTDAVNSVSTDIGDVNSVLTNIISDKTADDLRRDEQIETLTKEKETLTEENKTLTEEKGTLTEEKETLTKELDNISSLIDTLNGETL